MFPMVKIGEKHLLLVSFLLRKGRLPEAFKYAFIGSLLNKSSSDTNFLVKKLLSDC